MKKVIHIPASKSISNRLLILQYLFPEIRLKNLSTAKDTLVLQEALQSLKKSTLNKTLFLNIGHAGTAMRFLTALISTLTEKKVILDGSSRMQQRPIGTLVDVLQQMGANIKYLKKKGYPPLLIEGSNLKGDKIEISADISSQFITALLLIGPKLSDGLEIILKGKTVSLPYIKMTINILQKIGVQAFLNENENKIHISSLNNVDEQIINIEGDWSSASYFYGALSLLRNREIILKNFNKKSWQGDQKVADYFLQFGIKTEYLENEKIKLIPDKHYKIPKFLNFDLINSPDLAQTLAVTCLGMGINCHLSGLQTLRIKETDRISALAIEMKKLGAKTKTTNNSFEITQAIVQQKNVKINTYNDHRMAMSFAILQKKYPQIKILDKEVVVKSFPGFWELF